MAVTDIVELIDERARQVPDAVAVMHDGRETTYRDLVDRAGRVAAWLAERGVGAESVVGLCMDRGADLVCALLGILKSGAAYLPMDPEYPTARLEYMADDAGLSVAVMQQRFRDRLGDLDVLCIDADTELPAPIATRPAAFGDLAYVIYTSGSTGRPKGVMIERGQFTNFLVSFGDLLGIGADDRLLAVTTICFDIAGLEIFGPLAAGGRIIIADAGQAADGRALADLIERHGVTVMQATPVTWRIMLDAGWQPATNLRIACGGETFPPDLAARLAPSAAEVWNLYGPTETTVWAFAHRLASDHPGDAAVPLGVPVAGTTAHLVDDDLRPCTDGTMGELLLGGIGVSRGYFGRPNLTAERFVTLDAVPGERLYRTGDLATRRTDGGLDFHGRRDHQVKVRGYRIELGEVETALANLAYVGGCAVTVRVDDDGPARLVAYLTAAAGVERSILSAAAIRAELGRVLPGYMVPSAFVLLDELPLTPNRKVDRAALPGPDADTLLRDDVVAPQTPTEQALVRIWCRVLGLHGAGADDGFAALGGDSLRATRAAALASAELGVRPPMSSFFDGTLRTQAAWVDATGPAAAEPMVSEQAASFPPTATQRDLWTLRQLDVADTVTTIASRLRVHGPVPVVAIQQALDAIVYRHEALRTRYVERDGELLGVVGAPLGVPVEYHDRHGEADAIASAAARIPFDTAVDCPLIRASVVRIDAETLDVTVVTDHLAFDGASIGVLMTELAAGIEAYRNGVNVFAAVSAPRASIGGVATRDAALASDQRRIDALSDFWRGQLADAQVTPEPSARAGTAPTMLAADRVVRRLPVELLERVRAFSASAGVTAFATYLTALALLVGGLTGREDVLLGAVVSRRDGADLDAVIGPLVDVVPVRLVLSGDASMRTTVAAAGRTVAVAIDHQGLPTERLSAVAGAHLPAGMSLTPVVISVQPSDVPVRVEAGATRVELIGDVPSGGTQNPLTLLVNETVDGTELQFEFDIDRFDRVEAQRLIDRYVTVLSAAVDDPYLRDVPLVLDAERDELLAWSSGPALPPVDVTTTAELILGHCRRQPDQIAVTGPAGSLTYGEMAAWSRGVASGLRASGAAPGDVIGVCIPRDEYLPATLLAIWRAGCAYLPLDAEAPAGRLTRVLAEAATELVVARSQTLVAARAIDGATVFDLDVMAAYATDATIDCAVATDLAYVLYTSGSTGQPKGVEVSHANLLAFATSQFEVPGVYASDSMLAVAPLTFDTAGEEIWSPLAARGRVVIVERDCAIDGHALAERIATTDVTLAELTPTSLRMLLAAGWCGQAGLRVWAGGEALDQALVRAILPIVAELWNSYGPTEATVTSVVHRVTEVPSGVVPIGRPIAGELVYAVDGFGRLVPAGVIGELWLGGAGVARGYRGRADVTASVFVSDRWVVGGRCYRTGDLVRWRDDGVLEFLGRRDHQVKVRGYRIELGEVESLLRECPQVTDAAVVVHGSGPDASLAGYLSPSTVEPSEVAAHLRRILPDYMVPRLWATLDSLPTTVSGKLDRARLPAIDASGDTEWIEPQTPLQRLIADVWAEVLGVSRVGLRDEFFALGGHSFAATRVVGRLRAALGRPVTVRTVFDHSILADLAAALDETGSAEVMAPIRRRDIAAEVPLSGAQRRSWFASELDPSGVADNSPTVLRLRGPLNDSSLLAAVADVIERHAVLRMIVDSGPTVRTADCSAVPVLRRDLAEADLDAFLAAECARPFALADEPPLRVWMLRLGPDDHALALVLHHIVTDAWTESLLVADLGAHYAHRLGRAPKPAAPPMEYADFAIWEAAHQDRLDGVIDWWATRLDGIAPLLDLPTDRPRPSVAAWAAGYTPIRLDACRTERVARLAERTGSSPFMVLLAAWQLVLGVLAATDDVTVGVPESGRHHPEVDDMVGSFVNTLAMRTDLAGDPTGSELLLRVRDAALDAAAHAEAPFDRVVERCAPHRTLAGTPLVQVTLNVIDEVGPRVPFDAGLDVDVLDVLVPNAQFDLSLDLVRRPDAYDGHLVFRSDLWDPATMDRWIRLFQRAIDALTEHPQARLSEMSLLDADTEALLRSWSGADVEQVPLPGAHATVLAAFDARAASRPDAIAVQGPTTALTYAETAAWSVRVAAALAAAGVAGGTVVGACLPRDEFLPAILLGIWRAGAAYLPLDPEQPVARLTAMLADCDASITVCRGGGAGLPHVIDLETIPAAPEFTGPPVEPSDLAYVLFTSGSTGRPKGVEVTHANIAALAAAMAADPGLSPADAMLAIAPLTFDVCGSEIWSPLVAGARVVMTERDCAIDGHALAERIAATGVTVADLPATTLRMLLAAGWRGNAALRVFTGGESLDVALARDIRPLVADLWNMYGPTEATVTSVVHRVTGDETGAMPIGRPIAGEVAYVVDSLGRLVPPGVAGELWLGGAGVARGYRGFTTTTFIADPWNPGARCYRTGDLARWNDGVLEFLGRRDHQVKVRGYRIELGEVESLLRQCPQVADAAVTVARTDGDERLVAYVVWRDGVARDELRAHLRRVAPAHLVPHQIVDMDALPTTSAGKVDRAALPVVGVAAHAYEEPATPIEKLMAMLWADVLGRDRIGAADDFFALGGHSLAATRVTGRLRETLGCPVPVRALFEAPVLRGFAAVVEELALAHLAELDSTGTETRL